MASAGFCLFPKCVSRVELDQLRKTFQHSQGRRPESMIVCVCSRKPCVDNRATILKTSWFCSRPYARVVLKSVSHVLVQTNHAWAIMALVLVRRSTCIPFWTIQLVTTSTFKHKALAGLIMINTLSNKYCVLLCTSKSHYMFQAIQPTFANQINTNVESRLGTINWTYPTPKTRHVSINMVYNKHKPMFGHQTWTHIRSEYLMLTTPCLCWQDLQTQHNDENSRMRGL